MHRIDESFRTDARFFRWLRENRVVLILALLMIVMIPARDLWSPDEPDFAQCVKEMRERGTWLLPYLNGLPYSEKPILFYWLMKLSAIAGETLTGGAGFTHGIAAWALRLPSVAAAVAFLFRFHAWIRRFLARDLADLAALILATTPIWFWQGQFIQIDMVFSALLAWSWFAWLGGYLLRQDIRQRRHPGEERRWFLEAYIALALAFLAKGPLAFVLSVGVLGAFLLWQRDGRTLRTMWLGTGLLVMLALILPWYLAAGYQGGARYVYELVIHQNLERALHAWDHIQPWWKYAEYLAGDFFPWSLTLPALAILLGRGHHLRNPEIRFILLAAVVPIVLLSCSQSKQGHYMLMVYPFLALLLATVLHPLSTASASRGRVRALHAVLAVGLWIPAVALAALAFGHAGGQHLQETILPFLGPLRLAAAVLVFGAAFLTVRGRRTDGPSLVRMTAYPLAALFLVLGTWGFHRLDPLKNYRAWTVRVEPMIAGRRVYFWQTIRSGVMVYTDHLMPEVHDYEELVSKLGPEDRLVTMRREWDLDAWGMNAARRGEFEILASVPVGDGQALLLRKRNP